MIKHLYSSLDRHLSTSYKKDIVVLSFAVGTYSSPSSSTVERVIPDISGLAIHKLSVEPGPSSLPEAMAAEELSNHAEPDPISLQESRAGEPCNAELTDFSIEQMPSSLDESYCTLEPLSSTLIENHDGEHIVSSLLDQSQDSDSSTQDSSTLKNVIVSGSKRW